MSNDKTNNFKELDWFHIRIIRLLAGDRCHFSKNEFDELVKNMNDLNINTLSIQRGINNSYYCKVDDATVEFYKGKE